MNAEDAARIQRAFCYLHSLIQSNEDAQAFTFFKNVVATETHRAREQAKQTAGNDAGNTKGEHHEKHT